MLNKALLVTNTSQYKGKVLDHFEDEYGNHLKDLNMVDTLVIVFADGEKIYLSQDWYGAECYFSQRKIN